MKDRVDALIAEQLAILDGIEPGEILKDDDPDLLRIEEIMEEIKKLKDESEN